MNPSDLLGGYSEAQLSMAFNLVAHPDNWKLPIDTTLPARLTDEQLDLIAFAIGFYTGSKVEFRRLADGRTGVKAPGYYAAVGA